AETLPASGDFRRRSAGAALVASLDQEEHSREAAIGEYVWDHGDDGARDVQAVVAGGDRVGSQQSDRQRGCGPADLSVGSKQAACSGGRGRGDLRLWGGSRARLSEPGRVDRRTLPA